MADVKPETFKSDIAERIYVKFQRNPHFAFCIEPQSRTNVSPERRPERVSEKSKMAALNRK